MPEEHTPGLQPVPAVGPILADRYEIISLIGEGGMGLVYKARHVLMNRLVAIKMIRSEQVEDSTTLQRFRQEAQAISKLQHPNIVAVFDFGVSTENIPYLVMDYLEGTSIADLLATEGRLTFARALPLFVQACLALQHAHAKGIIHRDFKSSNLMICSEDGKDVVKVVDFGMAKLLSGNTDGCAQELTQAGDVFGSPLYMSPEQCKGQKLDQRSDIYSLGVVMYYVLTGNPPIIGDNMLDTLQRHIFRDPEPMEGCAADVPAGVEQVIRKTLSKKPEDRYQNISELLADFKAVGSLQERRTITAEVKGAQQKSAQRTAEMAKRPEKKPSHNFELNIIVAAVLAAAVLGLTAFMSGRMFEMEGDIQEANMWVDRNLDGDKARKAGSFADAEQYYREAVTEAQKFGTADPRLAKSLVSLGATYIDDKQYLRGESSLHRAMDVLEKCYGPNCPELSTVLLTLGRSLEQQGLHEEADKLRQRALALLESAVGSDRDRSIQMASEFVRKPASGERPEALEGIRRHVQSISRGHDQRKL